MSGTSKLIIHTASLYYWFDDYSQTLDDRIHAALDAGLDGVEISNGPDILTWQPPPETIKRLQDCLVTVHAEVGQAFGVTVAQLVEKLKTLPFDIKNVVFHPDELTPAEWGQLAMLPFPVSIENMDAQQSDWRTVQELKVSVPEGVGMTFDTAHAEENGLAYSDYQATFLPVETHLSICNDNDNYYQQWGYQTRHALTQFRPDDFPQVPSACPIVTLEGLVPPDIDILKDEVEFARDKLPSCPH